MPSVRETWSAADVRCPFFIGEKPTTKSIVCEGYAEKMRVSVLFNSVKTKSAYMGRHCAGPYERCPLYQLAMKKYEME